MNKKIPKKKNPIAKLLQNLLFKSQKIPNKKNTIEKNNQSWIKIQQRKDKIND